MKQLSFFKVKIKFLFTHFNQTKEFLMGNSCAVAYLRLCG